MKEKRSGKIINISSDAGTFGTPGKSAYCASKFAVQGFTDSLAKEVIEYNIGVTAVCPGLMNTPLADASLTDEVIRRLGVPQRSDWLQPREVAEAVLFVASQPPTLRVFDIMLRSFRELEYVYNTGFLEAKR